MLLLPLHWFKHSLNYDFSVSKYDNISCKCWIN